MRVEMVMMGFLFSSGFITTSCTNGPWDPGKVSGFLGQDPPGREPEVFAPGVISNGFHEHHLTISPDGDEVFYVVSSSDHEVYVILHIFRERGVWRGPTIAPFSGRYVDMGPSFSPDGRTLLFTSRRPKGDGLGVPADFDIWRVEKLGDAWSEPVRLDSPVNTDRNEIFPSISSNRTIYFQSYSEDGNESDLLSARWSNGEYQEPARLEFGISTEYYEAHPSISHDERYLIFQSIRPGGFGGVDFYVSLRGEDDTWRKPANLGVTVSARDNVISPFLSPDGNYFFFARNGPSESFSFQGNSYGDLLGRLRGPENGYGCLYWVDAEVIYDLHPQLRPR